MSSEDTAFCQLCKDNFIINKAALNCKFCQKKFHSHCLKVKDYLCKAVNESENFYWFCDTCRPVIGEKLASNLPLPPVPQKFIEAVESIVNEALDKKLQGLLAINSSYQHVIERKISDVMLQVTMLKDTNVDVIRMLDNHPSNFAHVNPPSSSEQPTSDNTVPISPETYVAAARHGSGQLKSASVLKGKNIVTQGNKASKDPPTASNYKQPKSDMRNSSVAPVPMQKGTGKISDLLKPAPKGRSWLWVGNLARDVSAEQIIGHVSQSFPGKDIMAFDLKSKSRKKSFKVGSNDIPLEDLQCPQLWPEGLLIRPFRSSQRK